MRTNNILIVFGLFTVVTLMAGTVNAQTTSWKAPASASTIKNPLLNDATAAKAGKKLYTQMCVICHGVKGKGDGMAGAALNPKPANFTSAVVKAETDGAIFWKMTTGNAPMASYKEVLTDQQRWQLVNYIRELGETTMSHKRKAS